MNEFIVWYSNDINENKFSKEFTLQELISQDHYDYISDSPLLVNYKVDSINRGIGLKDINEKSVYADSSIVEYGILKWKVIYNVFQMSYELECVSNKSLSNMRLTGAYQNQLKIIDTMQENKLGLV